MITPTNRLTSKQTVIAYGGTVTAGVIFVIKRLRKNLAETIQLDFAEYALGGYC
jgi:hypothetical protein